MPIYTYKCKDCGEEFKFHDIPGIPKQGCQCPKCGSKKIEQLSDLFDQTGSFGCNPQGL